MLTAKQPEIGKLNRELRQEMGLTQEKLTAFLGVTFPTINGWEKGRAHPYTLGDREGCQSTGSDKQLIKESVT